MNEASLTPELITNIYRQRMRIEENIRDTKCHYFGLRLKDSVTKCPQRMNILLLIAAITTFTAWLSGIFIKLQGNLAYYKSHSARFTTAL